jgi:signal transduction histidine kinase
MVDIVLAEAPLWVEMVEYSFRILTLSVVLSLLVASLLFVGLQSLIIEPLRRLTREIAVFRDRPEDATADLPPSEREDEIGVVERALSDMRQSLRQALAEKTRLAALGAAMTRISHDLKNILATAVLISDRLERSADPSVQKVAPRLVETLDRAARLCAETLSYARSGPPAPVVQRVNLLELVGKVRAALDGTAGPVRWRVEVPADLDILADSDQIFRVLLNLARNAAEAMGEAGGELRLTAEPGPQVLTINVADTGPGIPPKVQERLFEPFASSAKPEGSGLGLAICRELMRAHGGEIELLDSSERGTVFRLRLPSRSTMRAGGPRRARMKLETTARAFLLTLPLLPLAACGYQGPDLAGYPGLQFKTQSFYDARASEKGWTCPQPRMRSITGAQVVEETPTHVVMNVRYYWYDEGQTITDDDLPFPPPFFQRCNGFAERTFTYVKMTDGNLEPQSMTGPQRRG